MSRTSDDEWAHAVQQATENVTRIEDLNRASNQRGNSWSLPIPGGTYAHTPTWTSRTHWQHQVRTLLNGSVTLLNAANWENVA
ncbi:hypothetical protein [Rhodococcus erythropolis]